MSLPSRVREEEQTFLLVCFLQMQTNRHPQVNGSIRKGISNCSTRVPPSQNRYSLMPRQQPLNTRARIGNSRKMVHLPLGRRAQRTRQAIRMAEVARPGKQKEVAQTMQSIRVVSVMMVQQFASLVESPIMMIVRRKTLRTREGMQARTMLRKTKCTKLRYLPGAKASRQIRRVMNTIQKLAATVKATLPIRLIAHSPLLRQSTQLSISKSDSTIQLTSKMASTCRIATLSNRHLNIYKPTMTIRKAATPAELHRYADSAHCKPPTLYQLDIIIHCHYITL